jgi:glycine betaine catabolism B
LIGCFSHQDESEFYDNIIIVIIPIFLQWPRHIFEEIPYSIDILLAVFIVGWHLKSQKSNRDRNNILFKQEFDDWANINKNLKIIYTISEEDQSGQASSLPTADNWKGEYGRINKAMILKYLDTDALKNSIFYICCPPGMLKAMQTLLQEELEIPRDRIRVEEFTGY